MDDFDKENKDLWFMTILGVLISILAGAFAFKILIDLEKEKEAIKEAYKQEVFEHKLQAKKSYYESLVKTKYKAQLK